MKKQEPDRKRPEQKEKSKKWGSFRAKYKPEQLELMDNVAARRGESFSAFMKRLSDIEVLYRLGSDSYLASIDPDEAPIIVISLSRNILGRTMDELEAPDAPGIDKPRARITPAMMDLLCIYSSMTSILYAARRIIEKKQEDDPAAAEKFKDVVLAAVCIQDEIEKALGPNSFDLFKMFLVKREKANRGAVEEAAVETPAGPAGPC